jgi:hypothetical protein
VELDRLADALATWLPEANAAGPVQTPSPRAELV